MVGVEDIKKVMSRGLEVLLEVHGKGKVNLGKWMYRSEVKCGLGWLFSELDKLVGDEIWKYYGTISMAPVSSSDDNQFIGVWSSWGGALARILEGYDIGRVRSKEKLGWSMDFMLIRMDEGS